MSKAYRAPAVVIFITVATAQGKEGRDEPVALAEGDGFMRRSLDNYTTFTVAAGIYNSDRVGESVRIPLTSGGFGADATVGPAIDRHALRLGQETPEHEGFSIQAYYDRTDCVATNGLEVERDTVDLEFRHFFNPFDGNEFIWGSSYRQTWRSTDDLGVALRGQNLTEESHREFNDALFLARPAEVPRAVYLQATVRF